MIVEIDPGSMIPPYEQLRAQIAELVLAGALAPGARLPAVRQHAADLGVAPGTIARAYRELERGGLRELMFATGVDEKWRFSEEFARRVMARY